MKLQFAVFAFAAAAAAQLSATLAQTEEYATGAEIDLATVQAAHEIGYAFAYSSPEQDRKRGIEIPVEFLHETHREDYEKWLEQANSADEAVSNAEEGDEGAVVSAEKRSHTSRTFDWSRRASGNSYSGHDIVSLAKNQGQCGSCVTFALTGALESVALRKLPTSYNGRLYLSKQMLLDTAQRDNAWPRCWGRMFDMVYRWMAKKGRRTQRGVTEQYHGNDQSTKSYSWWKSHTSLPATVVSRKKVGRVKRASLAVGRKAGDLKRALVKYGPFGIMVQSDSKFQNYNAGSTITCGNGIRFNHGVLLVGWTRDYWIIRNSWGDWWGADGFAHLKMYSRGKQNCIRTGRVPVKVAVYDHGWRYRGTVEEKRQEEEASSGNLTAIDEETLAALDAIDLDALSDMDAGDVEEGQYLDILNDEDEPVGSGLPLRALLSESSSLVAFTEPDANDAELEDKSSYYTTLTFGPLGNSPYIEAEDITFTITAENVAQFEPFEELITTVQGKTAMQLGAEHSALMIEFLPQDSSAWESAGVDITPLKLVRVGVNVEVTLIDATSGAESVRAFDFGEWQPVLSIQEEVMSEDSDELITVDKDVLRHEMCIDDEQRAFLADLGAVKQVKVTLSVPKVNLPEAIVGDNLSFKVYVQRVAFTQCGALMAATGVGSDQVALSDEELRAAAAAGEDSVPVEIIVIVVFLVVLCLAVTAIAFWAYQRNQRKVYIGSSSRGQREGHSTTSRSHRSLSSERHSRRGRTLHGAGSRRNLSGAAAPTPNPLQQY